MLQKISDSKGLIQLARGTFLSFASLVMSRLANEVLGASVTRSSSQSNLTSVRPFARGYPSTVDALTVQNRIPDQVAIVDKEFRLPLNELDPFAYTGPDAKTLVPSVAPAHVGPLPPWLHFRSVTDFYKTLGNPVNSKDIEVSGDYVYLINSNYGLEILNVESPYHSFLVGSYEFLNDFQGITLAEDLAFVSASSSGVLILNISQPENPTEVSWFNSTSQDVALAGNFAYSVGSSTGLVVINIANPSNPSFVNAVATSEIAERITISNNLAFLSEASGVEIVDISNPLSPVVSSSYAAPNVNKVIVQSSIAFLMSGVNFDILNISNPNSPSLISSTPIGCSEAFNIVDSLFAIFPCLNFSIFDISNLSSPSLVTSRYVGISDGVASSVKGSFVYVADSTFGMYTVDYLNGKNGLLYGTPTLSDLGKLLLLASTGDGFGNVASDAFDLFVSRAPLLQSTFSTQSIHPNGFFSISVDTKQNFKDLDSDLLHLSAKLKNGESLPSWLTAKLFPTFLSSFGTSGSTTGSIKVVDNLVYASGGADGLKIFSISNPKNPTLIGSYDTPDSVTVVEVVDSIAYLGDTSSLIILDVSTPSAPALLGSYPIATGTSLEVHPPYAYITNSDLVILDISNPSSPTLVGQLTGFGGKFQVIGPLVFSANKIADVSDPSNPTIATTYPSKVDFTLVGDMMYSIQNSFAFFIDDYSDPLNLRNLEFHSLPIRPGKIETTGDLTFICGNSFNRECLFVDTSDPSVPLVLSSIDYTTSIQASPTTYNDLFFITNTGSYIYESNQWQFSGTPAEEDTGNYDVTLTAREPSGLSVSTNFLLRVEGPPKANSAIPPRLAAVGSPLTFFIDQSAFVDPNGDLVSYSAQVNGTNSLPSWLSFSQSGVFTGTPKSSDAGELDLLIRAFDGIAIGNAETQLKLIIDHFPEVVEPILTQGADIGSLYNFTVPGSTFFDADPGDSLNIAALQVGGSLLPAWLIFDNSTHTFTGTPQEGDVGTLKLELKATDSIGGATATQFDLIAQHFPRLVTPPPPQTASISKPFSYTIPSTTFVDDDGDALSYFASLESGAPLPSWLRFNPRIHQLFGTPQQAHLGNENIQILVSDNRGGEATGGFTLRVINSISDQSVGEGGSLFYQIADPIINNPQGPVVYSATLGDGSPLPSWLHFNSNTQIFTGTAPVGNSQVLPILVTANDGVQAPVSVTFEIAVEKNIPPIVANSLSNQVAKVDQEFRFVVPDTTFFDENGDSLAYIATKVSGKALPNWLSFDNTTRTFSGTPSSSDTGNFGDKVVPLKVEASDGFSKTETAFDLSVEGTSPVELALSIAIPLGTLGVFGYAWYKKRGLLLNRFNEDKYSSRPKTVVAGKESFSYSPNIDAQDITSIQAYQGKETLFGLKYPRLIQPFLTFDRPLPGGLDLPFWLRFNHQENRIYSIESHPTTAETGRFLIKIFSHGEVIKEAFTIEVIGGMESSAPLITSTPMQKGDIELNAI